MNRNFHVRSRTTGVCLGILLVEECPCNVLSRGRILRAASQQQVSRYIVIIPVWFRCVLRVEVPHTKR